MGEKQALVPSLRFPEFRNEGEWEESLIDDICYMQSGKFIAAAEISSDFEDGMFPCFGGNGLRGYTKTYNQSGRYSLIGRQGALCGNVNLVEGDFYATEHAVVTTPKLGISTNWLFYNLTLLNLNRFATGQAQPGLSVEVLDKVPCAVPINEKEQQKIADCLSSLDALISAQADKIDTLKTHKKGLMQQLFPREGETVPRLRFPEFRDAGEWRKCKLEELAKRGSGHTPNKKHPSYYNGGIKWVSLADSDKLDNGYIFKTKHEISEAGLRNSSAVLHSPGTVILSRDAGVGKSGVLYSSMAVSQHFIAWSCEKSKLSNWFLYYFLQKMKPTFESIAVGNTIKTIGLTYFKEMIIFVPAVAEQQKIADCLTFLDALIAAHTEKLDALKELKKGLMQKLFPCPEAT